MPTYTKSICLFPNRTHARTHTHTHSLSLSCTQHWCPSDTFFLLAHSQITLSLSFTHTHVLLLSLSLFQENFFLSFFCFVYHLCSCVRACVCLSFLTKREVGCYEVKRPLRAHTLHTHTRTFTRARARPTAFAVAADENLSCFWRQRFCSQKNEFWKKINIRSKAYRYGFAPRKLSRVIN